MEVSTLFTLANACLLSSELMCPACDATLKEPVSLACGHSYCRDPCIGAVMTHGLATCMVCSEPVTTPPEKLRVSNALCATLATLRWLQEAAQEQQQQQQPPPIAAALPAAALARTPPQTYSSLGSGAPHALPSPAVAAAAAAAAAVVAAAAPGAAPWECGTCTLENAGGATACVACGQPPAPAAAPPRKAPTAWERGEYSTKPREEAPQEEESWQPAQRGSKAGAWGGAGATASSGGGSNGSSSSGGSSSSSSGGGGSAAISPLGGPGSSSASKLIPLHGGEHPPNAVLKTSGAGSSFSKNGRGGGPGTGILLKFMDGAQQRGMVLTVVPGSAVRKGSHVHGFIGITRNKNKELFDQIQKTCPDGVREFRMGYTPNARHATLTFQFPDLMLNEEDRKLDEFGPEASRIMDSLLSKEVMFSVLWSPRWGRFVAHNVSCC